jgi:hypothetical protein
MNHRSLFGLHFVKSVLDDCVPSCQVQDFPFSASCCLASRYYLRGGRPTGSRHDATHQDRSLVHDRRLNTALGLNGPSAAAMDEAGHWSFPVQA